MLRNRFARRLAVLEARYTPPFRGTGSALSTEALSASLASYQDDIELEAAAQEAPRPVEEPPDLAAEVEVLERRRRELMAEVARV